MKNKILSNLSKIVAKDSFARKEIKHILVKDDGTAVATNSYVLVEVFNSNLPAGYHDPERTDTYAINPIPVEQIGEFPKYDAPEVNVFEHKPARGEEKAEVVVVNVNKKNLENLLKALGDCPKRGNLTMTVSEGRIVAMHSGARGVCVNINR